MRCNGKDERVKMMFSGSREQRIVKTLEDLGYDVLHMKQFGFYRISIFVRGYYYVIDVSETEMDQLLVSNIVREFNIRLKASDMKGCK